MRISAQSVADTSSAAVMRAVQNTTPSEKITKSENSDTTSNTNEQQPNLNENMEVSEEKVRKAVDSLNEFLESNNNSSKFVYHEGLDRYFVQVVDKETEEVVKEIPSKKLLDAFYEMQKFVGMIVDKKI